MKKFYLLSLLLMCMGLMAAPAYSANGAAAISMTEGEAETTTMTVDPAPGHYDGGLPTTFTLTFSSAITELETLMYRSGFSRGSDVDEEWYSWNEEKTVLTVTFPKEEFLGKDALVLSIEAKDANGEYAQYEGNEFVMLQYTTTLPSNTYECVGVEPMEGKSVAQLSKIELSFYNEADSWDFIGGLDESKQIVLKDASGQVVATATDYEVKMDEEDWYTGVLMFTLDKTIDEPGEYTLEVPEGMVYNSLYDGSEPDFGVEAMGALYNPEAYFILTVSPVKVDKLPGEYAEGLPETITLTFPKEIASVESFILRTQYSENFRGMNLLDVEGALTIEGNTVTLNIPSELLVGNEYAAIMLQVTDKDGMQYAYESYGNMIQLVYTTDLPDDRFTCVASPSSDEVVEELSVVELTFVNPALASDYIGNDLSVQSVPVYNENGVAITTANLSIKPGDNGFDYSNVVVAKFAKVIGGIGSYYFSIPEKLVYNSYYNDWEDDFGVSQGAIYNPATTFEFTIAKPDGIENVEVAGKQVEIYNVAGQKLRETDLNKLGRGVYIVNGKKVVVK